MCQLFLNLLTASLYGSVIILLVIFLRLILKKVPKSIIYLLWLLTGLRLILPFSIESSLSLQPEISIASQQPQATAEYAGEVFQPAADPVETNTPVGIIVAEPQPYAAPVAVTWII